jgi:hypothetical protein
MFPIKNTTIKEMDTRKWNNIQHKIRASFAGLNNVNTL